MQPIASFPSGVARALRGVFMDIDDTLTIAGKLTADAYLALWRLKAAGLWVVPVTGRPAGWCDLIARQWPVDGVVGENGALAFYETGGHLERIIHPDVAGPEAHERLRAIRETVLEAVPGSRVAKDQPYRLYDLAIDFREEPPDLGLAAAEQIRDVFVAHGAHAKVSSIHVNGWFGDYDKLAMVRLFAAQRWGAKLEGAAAEQFVFCGDSPNDEPMFAAFPNACAVANIARFGGKLRRPPRYVTRAAGGAGFAELVEVLLERREA